MGIAGAGNSGTAIAPYGPKIAEAYGWHSVFGIAIIPLVLILISYILMAKDSPINPNLKSFFSIYRFFDMQILGGSVCFMRLRSVVLVDWLTILVSFSMISTGIKQ